MFNFFNKVNFSVIGIAIVACVVCFYVGRMTAPVKTTTKTETIVVEKTVEYDRIADIVKRTIIESQKTQLNNDKTETKVTKTSPDGTKIEEVVTVDKGTVIIDNSKNIQEEISHTHEKSKTTENSTTTTTEKIVETGKKNWHISLIGSREVAFNRSLNEMFGKDWIYGLQVERRVFGDLYVGAFGQSSSELGLSLGVSF